MKDGYFICKCRDSVLIHLLAQPFYHHIYPSSISCSTTCVCESRLHYKTEPLISVTTAKQITLREREMLVAHFVCFRFKGILFYLWWSSVLLREELWIAVAPLVYHCEYASMLSALPPWPCEVRRFDRALDTAALGSRLPLFSQG